MISFTSSIPWESVCGITRAITGTLPERVIVDNNLAIILRKPYDLTQVEGEEPVQTIPLDEDGTFFVLAYAESGSRRFKWDNPATDEAIELAQVEGAWRLHYASGSRPNFYRPGTMLLTHFVRFANLETLVTPPDAKHRLIADALRALRDVPTITLEARAHLIELCRLRA